MEDETSKPSTRRQGSSQLRPRDWAEVPEVFGKTLKLDWRPAQSDAEGVQLRAAQLQNRYAVLIRRGVRREKLTLTRYARKGGIGYGRLTKVLRGEVVMRLEDIAYGDFAVGGVSELDRTSTPDN